MSSGTGRTPFEAVDTPSRDQGKFRLVSAIAKVADGVPVTDTFFMDPRERVLRWAGSMLGGLSDETSADDVLSSMQQFPSLGDRIAILYAATRDRDTGQPPACTTEVIRRLAEEATSALLANLKQQDSAPIDDGIGWVTHFLRTHGLGPRVAQLIEEALQRNEIHIR